MADPKVALGSGPRLLVPAVYVDNVSTLRKHLRVHRINDAVHVQYRWPELGYEPRPWRW